LCPLVHTGSGHGIFYYNLCYARYDKYPVNNGYLLIVTYRHFGNYFDATHEEKLALIDMIDKAKEFLSENFAPDRFNIGINTGEAAGQTVMHFHCHVIPRYKGDIKNPRGGVRGVIPEKMDY